MEWYREKEIGIVFMRKAWIEKDGRGTQTHLSFVLISTVRKGRRVMAYVRKGIEEEVEVVKEEDNHIILQIKNKKKIGKVYTNRRWYREKWRKWLRKLEKKTGRESSILRDWNTHSHS